MGKQIRDHTDLVAIGIIVVALLVVVALSAPVPLRVIFGLPFMLFFPGYTLVAACFQESGRSMALKDLR